VDQRDGATSHATKLLEYNWPQKLDQVLSLFSTLNMTEGRENQALGQRRNRTLPIEPEPRVARQAMTETPSRRDPAAGAPGMRHGLTGQANATAVTTGTMRRPVKTATWTHQAFRRRTTHSVAPTPDGTHWGNGRSRDPLNPAGVGDEHSARAPATERRPKPAPERVSVPPPAVGGDRRPRSNQPPGAN